MLLAGGRRSEERGETGPSQALSIFFTSDTYVSILFVSSNSEFTNSSDSKTLVFPCQSLHIVLNDFESPPGVSGFIGVRHQQLVIK